MCTIKLFTDLATGKKLSLINLFFFFLCAVVSVIILFVKTT